MKALDAKLRAQAQRKGLKPGSPSWVKYVPARRKPVSAEPLPTTMCLRLGGSL
jgi:hypothetical protein